MSRIAKKYIKFGIGATDVNAQSIPATNTPTNYTPVQVASEGTDKVSAHLNGINNALSSVSGDIPLTTWSGLANNTANQTITGLSFASGIRSFRAQIAFTVNATANLYVQYEIEGIQRAADWQVTANATGDAIPGVSFDSTTGGQIRVSIGSVTGFTSGVVKFRATVIPV